jgi:hypothetical protein
MGNFLNNVIKSREEWLKKPNPIPNRAIYLKAQAQAHAHAHAQAQALIKSNLKTNPDTNLKTK